MFLPLPYLLIFRESERYNALHFHELAGVHCKFKHNIIKQIELDELITLSVTQIHHISVSPWYLVDWANIIVQRNIEHGILKHFTNAIVKTIISTLEKYKKKMSVAKMDYLNLIENVIFMWGVSIVVFIVEMVIRGKVALWMWKIVV